MKDKKQILYERALISCIIMLAVCTILKLFGAEWFNLDTGIPLLNKMDELVCYNYWTITAYSLTLKLINFTFICSITLRVQISKSLKYGFCMIPILLLSMYAAQILDNQLLKVLSDYLVLLLMCGIMNKKEKLISFFSLNKTLPLIYLLNVIYQGMSLYIRDLGYVSSEYNSIERILLSFDYYILLYITYLIRKERESCGIVASFSSLVKPLWKERTNHSNQSLLNRKGE